MPIYATIITPEHIDLVLQVLGGGVGLLLVKFGIREWRRKSIESLGLMDKNVLWAQDMMDRLESQIAALERRIKKLEEENNKLRATVENYRVENFKLELRVKELQDGKAKT